NDRDLRAQAVLAILSSLSQYGHLFPLAYQFPDASMTRSQRNKDSVNVASRPVTRSPCHFTLAKAFTASSTSGKISQIRCKRINSNTVSTGLFTRQIFKSPETPERYFKQERMAPQPRLSAN